MKYTCTIAALLMSSTVTAAGEPVCILGNKACTNGVGQCQEDGTTVCTPETDGAAAAAQTAAKHADCSNKYMTDAVENQIKAKSQLEVAATLIKMSNKLRDEASAALPAAKKALEDYEKTLTSAELTTAADAFKAAQKKIALPEQSHNAWKDMAESREDVMMGAFKTWTSYQELWESQKATLAQFKEDKINYEAQDSMNSTAETQAKIADVDFNIQKATETVAMLVQNVADNEVKYKNAGQQFQDADKEREIAFQVLTTAQASLADAQKLLVDLSTGVMAEQATQLKTLQKGVTDLEEKFAALHRDAQRSYLMEILATQRKEAAIAAFALAETTCAKLGGDTNPVDLAAKIVEEREKNAELVASLDAEDKALADQIVTGGTNFDCREIEKWQGTLLTRPVRPLCNIGWCCGAGLNASDGFAMETCQPDGTLKVTYQPLRAKNATGRKPMETLDFQCIEGAQKIAASAAALLSALYILA